MLTAIIILSMLSLLVATEAEPTGSTEVTLSEKPLRPQKKSPPTVEPKRDRIAA